MVRPMRWVVLTLLLLGSPGLAWSALAVPQEMAGLPLVHSQQGAEARQAIEQLHGKNIPMRDGFVAHYGSEPPVAMLYVSRAQDEKAAQQQVEQMTTRIQAGTGPFHHWRESLRFGITIYSLLGQGQVHYYFRRGPTLVWVAADPVIAQQALADAVKKLR